MNFWSYLKANVGFWVCVAEFAETAVGGEQQTQWPAEAPPLQPSPTTVTIALLRSRHQDSFILIASAHCNWWLNQQLMWHPNINSDGQIYGCSWRREPGRATCCGRRASHQLNQTNCSPWMQLFTINQFYLLCVFIGPACLMAGCQRRSLIHDGCQSSVEGMSTWIMKTSPDVPCHRMINGSRTMMDWWPLLITCSLLIRTATRLAASTQNWYRHDKSPSDDEWQHQ